MSLPTRVGCEEPRMAAAPTPFRGRLLALEALLIAVGIGFLAVFAWQIAQLRRDVPMPASVPAAAPSEHERALAYERERLPTLFPNRATAARFGLRIIPSTFDLVDPPDPRSLFHVPLPGLSPSSPTQLEFFGAGFVVGRAESFELVDVRQGRLTLVAWAFTSHEGALRAYRAYRETGIPGIRNAYAEDSALKGSATMGLEELIWVRGRLLLQSSYAAPQDDLTRIRRAHDRLTALFDGRVMRHETNPVPVPRLPDLSVLGRLRATEIPERDLPGGWSTSRAGTGAAPGAPQGGVAAPSLDVAFSELGVLGTHRQVIRIAGFQLARLELAAQRYPSAAAAARALRLVAARPLARPQRVRGIGPAILVPGPGGLNYSDLWWRQGPLLLRASSYASRLAPLPPRYRTLLARRLAVQAERALALAPA